MKIKIVSVPPGQAPMEVRQQWVGMTLPVVETSLRGLTQTGALGGQPENLGGYPVETAIAIDELTKKGSVDAAEWWRRHTPPEFAPFLVFNRTVCKLVD